MTTTSSRFFDELAKLMNNAAGAAQGVRREIDTLVKSQVERVLNDMGVVRREDFEVVRDMAQRAREENERLAARLSEHSRQSDGWPQPPRNPRGNAELKMTPGLPIRVWRTASPSLTSHLDATYLLRHHCTADGAF